MKEKIKAFLGALIIISLFILVSYFAKTNQEFVSSIIGDGFSGILIYLLVVIIAIVVAPISMMPFVPIAANMWGWFNAALIHIVGWSLGSFIVFFISRKYGVPLIRKFVSLKKINEYEKKISKEEVFWGMVVLRMITPVDILSYALSLFTKVKFKTYALATIIGIIPFAFAFSYLGTVPFYYQIAGFVLIGLIVTLVVEFYKKRN